jgi:hypothetical protein
MTVRRSDIQRALDELMSNEAGMSFQGLAVVLAKQKWPDLIASERKWDRGLDAYAPASLASDGVGKGLASSLTATLEKVRTDAKKIHEHFSDVSVLIFATPTAVTNHTANEWAKAIKKSFGFDLVVMTREDIVTELLLPANAGICRSHLAIAAPVESSVGDSLMLAQEAAGEVLAAWFAHPRLTRGLRLDLQTSRLSEEGRDTGELLDIGSLHQALLESRRIVLEAPAGRGKTTMLLQLAEHPDSNGLALLIDLPAWITSGTDVLEFVGRSRAFASRGIDARELARLSGAAQFRFLLNGWNEISDSYSERAQGALAELERSFPTAGIIVATRTHQIRPPLPGSFRLMLLPLSRAQRAEYLRLAVGNRAAELGALLEGERVLDDLTRTPLILAEVTRIFQSGEAIPKTKMGVLNAVLRLAEQSEEHRGPLVRPPLDGRARDYLAGLALRLVSQGDVTISEADARATVHSVSDELGARGQIATTPEPAAILGALCAHSVLVRVEYPALVFRFDHQQVQELFAATELMRLLYGLGPGADDEAMRRYTRDYVNQPVWEEPLRMVAEEIGAQIGPGSGTEDATAAGAQLVEMALLVDPVFAADLSRLCGRSVWAVVGSRVGERLRAWYGTADQNHQECALAAMFGTGSEDFSDIILPLLNGDDQQVRLRVYRTGVEFHLSTLGRDWRRVVEGWNEERRSEFVAEVVRGGRLVEVAEEFARMDPSPKVRGAALQALEWVGAREAISRVLSELDDQAFERVLKDRVLDGIPAGLKGRALETYRSLVANAGDVGERVRLRLAAVELGPPGSALDGLREDVGGWAVGRVGIDDEALLRSALGVLRRSDSAWVNRWLIERIADGSLWPERWAAFVTEVPEDVSGELFAKLIGGGVRERDEDRVIAVLKSSMDADLVKRAFAVLCRMSSEAGTRVGEESERRWAIERQLQHLIRAVPPDVAVAGILDGLSRTLNGVECEVVARLFGQVNPEESVLRGQLRTELQQGIRQYLKEAVSFALSEGDFGGQLKAEVATALARVGEPKDMSDLELLVWADIERVRRGRAARARGERSAEADGAVMSWSNWHVRAMMWLDIGRAEGILLTLEPAPVW